MKKEKSGQIWVDTLDGLLSEAKTRSAEFAKQIQAHPLTKQVFAQAEKFGENVEAKYPEQVRKARVLVESRAQELQKFLKKQGLIKSSAKKTSEAGKSGAAQETPATEHHK